MAVVWNCFDTDVANADGVATIRCLEPLVRNAISAVVALAGVGLFVMLITGGFTFLFSGGDQKKLDQAKNTITFAIIGLIVMVAAYLIMSTIEAITDVTVTQFQIKLN